MSLLYFQRVLLKLFLEIMTPIENKIKMDDIPYSVVINRILIKLFVPFPCAYER
jgi:hypothetical protein